MIRTTAASLQYSKVYFRFAQIPRWVPRNANEHIFTCTTTYREHDPVLKGRKNASTKEAYLLIMHAPFIENFDQFFSPPFMCLRRGIHAHLPPIGWLQCVIYFYNITLYAGPVYAAPTTTIGPAIYCNNLQSLHIYNTRTLQAHTHTHCTIHTVDVHILYNNNTYIQYTQIYIIFIILPVGRSERERERERGHSFIRADGDNIYVVHGMCVFYVYNIFIIMLYKWR